ncbi:MAG: hypothetical protein ACKVP3_18705, partial [Hyphomicrobiaceae bacterium]
MRKSLGRLAILAFVFAVAVQSQPAEAQTLAQAETRSKAARVKAEPRPPLLRSSTEQKRKEAINSWTVGLAAGR